MTELTQKRLLLPYYLIPFILLIPLADQMMFHGRLQAALPQTPEKILLFTIFFVFPHIVASSLLFLNEEYLEHYGKKLVLGLSAAIGAGIAIPLIFGYLPLLLVYGILTVNHVIGQQLGLTRIGLKHSGTAFRIWKYSGLILGNLAYMYIFLKDEYLKFPPEWIFISAAILFTVTMIMFIDVYREATTADGRRFVMANQLLFFSIVLLAFLEYPFFAILIPRVIHDTCAFMTYWVHDSNRFSAGKPHPLKPPGHWQLPLAAGTPIAALILAFPVTWYATSFYGEIVAICFAFFHYFTEAFAWKRGSLLRSWVPMR